MLLIAKYGNNAFFSFLKSVADHEKSGKKGAMEDGLFEPEIHTRERLLAMVFVLTSCLCLVLSDVFLIFILKSEKTPRRPLLNTIKLGKHPIKSVLFSVP